MIRMNALCLTFALALSAGTASADYVVLKTGEVMEGKVEDLGATVAVTVRGMRITISRSSVTSIEKGRPPAGSKHYDLAAAVAGPKVAEAKKISRMSSVDRRASAARRLAARSRAKALVGQFASAKRDRSEQVLNELVALEPFPTVTVASSLGDPNAGVRGWIVKALAASEEDDAAKPLVRVALTDSDPELRAAAAKAIGGQKNPKALDLLIARTREAKDMAGVERAAAAVNAAGQKRAITAMITFVGLDVRTAKVTMGTMRRRSIRSSGGAIDLPIELPTVSVSTARTSLRVPVVSVLQRVAGVEIGPDRKAWAAWWKDAQGNFSFD